jgi:hypothetical protein
MSSVLPRLPYIWIPDDKVHLCFSCASEFSVVNRRHHCRSCGRIFCGNCCFRFQSLPSYLPKTSSTFCDGKRHKVCTQCDTNIARVKKSRNWILIFSYLPVTIREYTTLGMVSTEWKIASDAVLSVFKAIQYKVAYQKWSGIERRIVSKNWREFAGHSRLMVQALRALVGVTDISVLVRYYKDKKPLCSCESLHCAVACSERFNQYDIIELLSAFPSAHIMETREMESWIGTSLQNLNHSWLTLLIPFLLQAGFTAPIQRIIVNNLLPMVVDDRVLAYKFYFETNLLISIEHKYQSYFRSLIDRFIRMLPKDLYADLDQTERFLYALKTPDRITEYDFKGVRLPFDPDTTVENVHLSRIRRLSTFTAPWIVPIDTSRGGINLLVKHDDLRKDRFVMDIVRILNTTIDNLSLRTYNILPVTTEYGIVEMIPQCISLLELNKTTTLSNYIVRHNMNESNRVLRQTFLRSCASNAVLNYMLGLGDRNLGNILVTHTGEIVHIDFSYILGHDPKNNELTEMRITPGMLDMLGGKQSPEFEELIRLSSSMYTRIKTYTYFWCTLFHSLATTEPPIKPFHNNVEEIIRHVETRLIPLATEEEVVMKITDVVEKNSGSTLAGWVDSFHSMKTSVEDLMFNLDFGFS